MKLKYIYYFEIVYGSFLFSNFRNILKQNGKSFVSEKALYRSFFLIMLKVKDNPYLFIFEVLELLRPYLFVKFKTKVSRNKTKLVAFVTHINTLKQYKQGLK
jgi:ribosomal protein S7